MYGLTPLSTLQSPPSTHCPQATLQTASRGTWRHHAPTTFIPVVCAVSPQQPHLCVGQSDPNSNKKPSRRPTGPSLGENGWLLWPGRWQPHVSEATVAIRSSTDERSIHCINLLRTTGLLSTRSHGRSIRIYLIWRPNTLRFGTKNRSSQYVGYIRIVA